MSGIGALTHKENKELQQTLRQLDEILTRRFLLGGNEVREMLDLASRIPVRLHPHDALLRGSKATAREGMEARSFSRSQG